MNNYLYWFVDSLFYDALSVTVIYSVNDRVINE
jgi:hypothetical protein